jgi:type I restriction enzyme S subunit
MKAAQVLDHFDRISDAPGAIPRLRGFVLDLAVRGKLVEQDPNDEPASELLKRISAERVRLIRADEIKERDVLPPINAEEVPFDVPVRWELVRLGEALQLINGRAFKPTEWSHSGLPIIRIQNLNDPAAAFNFCNVSIPDKFHVNTGDFLISWSGTPGTSFGAHIWDRGHAILNQHIFRVKVIGDAFLLPFLKLAINSRLLELIDQAHGGVGLQHITKPKLERLPLTVPPLAEQYRIVAKVDELMALCDRLGAAQTERQSRRDRLAATSLHRLNNGVNGNEFRGHARFYLYNLPRLTTRVEHIQQLRQTILNLAVRGKLVPQNPNDEPASELLKRIQREKEQLIKTGEVKRAPPPAPINSAALPFSIPSGWSWVRVQQLLEPKREISYGVIKLGSEPNEGGIPTLRCSDVKSRYLDISRVRKVSEDIEREYSRTRLVGGEILLNIRGTLGGVALVPLVLNGYNVAREVAVIPISKEVFGSYLVNVMASPYFWDVILESLRGIAYKGLNLSLLRLFEIPLPPLAEQHRIVAKVDEMMALCDRLEAQLATTQTESCRLLEAVLREALRGAHGE